MLLILPLESSAFSMATVNSVLYFIFAIISPNRGSSPLYGLATTWEAYDYPPWSPRIGFGVLLFTNRIFIFSGGKDKTRFPDSWSSYDLKQWSMLPTLPWSARMNFGCVVRYSTRSILIAIMSFRCSFLDF
jgi:hypothetical protein